MPPLPPLVLHYVLQPRRHQHKGRVTVLEGPDNSRPPPDLAGGTPAPLEEPGDVLDPPGRDAREVHLDDGLLVNDLLFSRWKSYDEARAVLRYAIVTLRKNYASTSVLALILSSPSKDQVHIYRLRRAITVNQSEVSREILSNLTQSSQRRV